MAAVRHSGPTLWTWISTLRRPWKGSSRRSRRTLLGEHQGHRVITWRVTVGSSISGNRDFLAIATDPITRASYDWQAARRPTSTPLASVAASSPRPQTPEPPSCAVSALVHPVRDVHPVRGRLVQRRSPAPPASWLGGCSQPPVRPDQGPRFSRARILARGLSLQGSHRDLC
jgi:hypothetical protein